MPDARLSVIAAHGIVRDNMVRGCGEWDGRECEKGGLRLGGGREKMKTLTCLVITCTYAFLVSCTICDGRPSGDKIMQVHVVSSALVKYQVQVRHFGDVESTVAVDSNGFATATIPSMRNSRMIFFYLPFLAIHSSQETDSEIRILEGEKSRKTFRLDHLLKQPKDAEGRYLIEINK